MGEQNTSGLGLDARLIGLCALLWVVAGGILWANWPDTRRDYYWGNIMQGLEGQPPRIDQESINALAAMGDSIIPSCSHELQHHWNPQFKCAVVYVLERTEGKGARDLIAWAVTHDLDARVRANGLKALSERTKRHPDEQPALTKLAEDVALGKTTGDPNLEVRTTAALLLGQAGDDRAPVKALLVHGLRSPFNPFVRNPMPMRECAAALAHVNSGAPAFNVDAKGKDLIDAIIAYEEWCMNHDIALVESRLVLPAIAPVGTGAATTATVTTATSSPVTTQTGDGK